MAQTAPDATSVKVAELLGDWKQLKTRRIHAEAEVALCVPDHPWRRRIEKLTREHPRFEEKYERQLARQQRLAEHEKCVDRVMRKSEEVQRRVRYALALDCEMVQTVGDDMALARVSCVDVQGHVVLDVLVLPCDPTFIEDCRTTITGLTKSDLVNKGVSLERARELFALVCCEETLLMGHALDHDLLALKFKHEFVVDTAHLYPVLNDNLLGPNLEALHSLDFLSNRVLRRGMDRESRGGVHDSVEDARNSLDLVKYCLLAGARISVDRPPPIARRGRNRRKALPGTMTGRNDFAKEAAAETFIAGTTEEEQRTQRFFAFELPSSVQVYGIAPAPGLEIERTSALPRAQQPSGIGAKAAPKITAPPSKPRFASAMNTDLYLDHLRTKEATKRVMQGNSRISKLLSKSSVSSKSKRSKLFR